MKKIINIYLLFIVVLIPNKCYSQKNERVRHIKEFGAIGDGIFNNTKSFQQACKWLSDGGGTLVIDSGVYLVGDQRLTKSYTSGAAYFDEPIISLSNVDFPITIEGKSAILKVKNGLKYGSFNPITGEKDSLRQVGNKSAYYGSAFTIINMINCKSITVKGLTLDGNSGKLDIGPSFGPEGIQLSATGIRLYNNKNVLITDCYVHHCALDGILIGWTGLKTSDKAYSHTIQNVKSLYNGRQGLSWVGGNALTVINSEFSSTGKSLNNDKYVVSKPSAGIDIEIEGSIICNGFFYNCLINDNAGPGVSSIGHETNNIKFGKCTFVGTTNSAAYPKSQGFNFDSCTFIGKVERIFGSSEKSKAIAFNDCLFTMDSSLSPTGKVFGDYCEFYEGKNVVFNNCIFNAAKRRLPVFNSKEITFLNCSFLQDNPKDFRASATFSGKTEFILKGGGKLDKTEATFKNKIINNGVVE